MRPAIGLALDCNLFIYAVVVIDKTQLVKMYFSKLPNSGIDFTHFVDRGMSGQGGGCTLAVCFHNKLELYFVRQRFCFLLRYWNFQWQTHISLLGNNGVKVEQTADRNVVVSTGGLGI